MSEYNFYETASVVACLVRSNNLYEAFKERVTPDCFKVPKNGMYIGEDYQEYPLLLIWLGLKLYYDSIKMDSPPTSQALAQYVQIVIRQNNFFTERNIMMYILGTFGFPGGSLSGSLIEMMCDKSNDQDEITGGKLISDFLMERIVMRDLRNVMTYSDNMSKSLEDVTQSAQEISAISTVSDIKLSFPDDDFYKNLPEAAEKHTTGFAWMDHDMNGGQEAEGCYGIFGYTGAGKTTTICTMAANQAKDAYRENPDNPDLIVIYSYEQSKFDYIEKFMSGAAEIARGSIELSSRSTGGLLNPSTDPMNPKPYEREVWPDDSIRLSEIERLRRWQTIGNKTIVIRNFSGRSDPGDTKEEAAIKSQLGFGGVPEIKWDLKRIQNMFGAKIRTVFIDYAGLMCSRLVGKSESDGYAYYSALRSLVDDLYTKVAGTFHCACWVVHQLCVSQATRSPLRIPSMADFDGCKSMAYNMPYCYALGAPDKKNKNGEGVCFRFVQIKGRKSASNESADGRILQHNRWFDRVDDVTRMYRIDRATGSFVLKSQYKHKRNA